VLVVELPLLMVNPPEELPDWVQSELVQY